MPDEARTPTVLERAIGRGRANGLGMQAVLWVLAASDLMVPTTEDWDGDLATFKPLLLKGEGGVFLAVFTHPDHIGDFAATAPAFVSMKGNDVLSRMPPGNGLTVNPGTKSGFEWPSHGVAAIVDELANAWE